LKRPASTRRRRSTNKQALTRVLVITSAVFAAEVAGGIASGSLALLSDAVHMLGDVGALTVSLLAIRFADRPPTREKTFGFFRAEILAALFNAAALIGISFLIFREAYSRLIEPPEIEGGTMLGVALLGLAANVLGVRILSRADAHADLNLRGALLHAIGDALGSGGAVVAGVVIVTTGVYIVDPIVSVIIGVIILRNAWRLMNETVHVLLEGVPQGLSIEDVERSLGEIDGVLDVHDLHVWSITSGLPSLSVHLVVRRDADDRALLERSTKLISDRFGIEHSTVQIEREGYEHRRLKV